MGNEVESRIALILARDCRVGESLQKKREKALSKERKKHSYKFPAVFIVGGTGNGCSLTLLATRL